MALSQMSTQPRHMLAFDIVVPLATRSEQLHPDKENLRLMILDMCAQGMSYREISAALGIYCTRVGQILRRKS